MKRLVYILGLTFSLGVVRAEPVRFDIPAQPIEAAIAAFIKQSGRQVVLPAAPLEKTDAPALTGLHEPADALRELVKKSGYTVVTFGEDKLAVTKRTAPKAIQVLKGSLVLEDGSPARGVRVWMDGLPRTALTNGAGDFFLFDVPPGTHQVTAELKGYQTLQLTNIRTREGQSASLEKETMVALNGDATHTAPRVVRARAIMEMDTMQVKDVRPTPFMSGNLDLPRTANDVQPYYIFDKKTIDQSGSISIEDFLRNRLTMNAQGLTNGQTAGANSWGNTSSIDLRGLGSELTLVLVDGRRLPGVTIGIMEGQPDLNGIPLSSVERIEILPSSASGIYGGGAIGGVVNIVLKKDYVGGEIRATYDNTFDTDSARRSVAISYGFALEGGKTQVSLNASWSDAATLLLADRRDVYDRNVKTLVANSPDFFYWANTIPILGASPNITSTAYLDNNVYVMDPGVLTLKNGGSIGSRNTYVPVGTSPSTPGAMLNDSLRANAGKWNTDLADSTQSPLGLRQPFGVTPKSVYYGARATRQMTDWLRLNGDFTYSENNSTSVFNPIRNTFTVPKNSPVNPFNQAVVVQIPDATAVPSLMDSSSLVYSLGTFIRLPRDWTALFDASLAQSKYSYLYYNVDTTAMNNDLASGVLNPFVDTLLYPLNLNKYYTGTAYAGKTDTHILSARASGKLPALPWGEPSLTVGLERRVQKIPEITQETIYPVTKTSSNRTTYFQRRSATDSVYAELLAPLVKQDWLPLVHSLELQLTGRQEMFDASSGTVSKTYYYNVANPFTNYNGPTLNNQPVFSRDKYDSTNYTVGFKYEPIPDVIVRASTSTAFVPPRADQLMKNPAPEPFVSYSIRNPRTHQTDNGVQVISGGNPELKPQNSNSYDAGVIWMPKSGPLAGLRLNAQYYRTKQQDAIGTLVPQQIVDEEASYPGRVTRDSTGKITLIDMSLLNLFKYETDGWDFSGSYTFKTSVGTFFVQGNQTIINGLKTQLAKDGPQYDGVSYPNDGGGAVKYKSNLSVTWDWRRWTATWTARYTGSYKQNGAAGGPADLRNLANYANTVALYKSLGLTPPPYSPITTYTQAQGSDTVSSQLYHDVVVGYSFGKQSSSSSSRLAQIGTGMLDGLTVQVGVRNLFDKVAPLDAYMSGSYYQSPYGDIRLRTYWVTVKKAF